MKFWCTTYKAGLGLFGEEIHGETLEDAFRELFARGLGETLDAGQPRDKPYTESVLPLYDAGDFAGAAHGACQLLRLQNDPVKALAALSDHGLVHELIHMSIMPDEPVVTCRRYEVRDELAALEGKVRPGLNISKPSLDET